MLCCLLLRMFHENLSMPCTCGKQMKGDSMCYCTAKERLNYSKTACEDVSGPNSAPSHPWQFSLKSISLWDDGHAASIRLPTCTVLTPLVMHNNCLCMSGVVICCLVNCLWCFTCNTYPGSLRFPQAPLYQSLLGERPNGGPQQQFWWIILCVLRLLWFT